MERPTDEALRKAQTTLRGLVSDGPSRLPSLNLIADSIRLELEKSGQVALLYVSLSRYGRLEPVFGWRIVGEILDAVAANLEGMVGSTLRRLDVVSDFTLTDDAFIVLLSPPRSTAVIADDDLAAITRRVYERLQSLLLNDLAPGVYDRVHPSVGAAVLAADPSETFEQNLQRGLALAMQAAGEQAALYDRDLEATLADCVSRGDLEPLFEPVVDLAAREVVGYRSTVRGPFYSPLRLPDVLLDVARRSQVLASYGVSAREATVSSAAGLRPDDLLFLGCAAGELPNAAVVAVSEFYSLNQTLVPQHVVFDIDAARPRRQHRIHAAHARRRPRPRVPALRVRARGAVHDAGAHRRGAPGLPVPRPGTGGGPERRPHGGGRRPAARALRRSRARAAHRHRRPRRGAAAPADAQRRGVALRRGVRARRHAAAAGDVRGVTPRVTRSLRNAGAAAGSGQALRLAGSSRSPATPVKIVTRLRPRRLLS